MGLFRMNRLQHVSLASDSNSTLACCVLGGICWRGRDNNRSDPALHAYTLCAACGQAAQHYTTDLSAVLEPLVCSAKTLQPRGSFLHLVALLPLVC